MVFRLARTSDADPVYEIIKQGKRRLADLGIDQWQGNSPNRDMIEEDIAKNRSYVIEDEGDIVATAVFIESGEPTYDEIFDGAWLTESASSHCTYLTIHRMAVGDSALKSGLAQTMLLHAERLALERGLKSIRIDTHFGNIPMQRLCEKCGFTRCGTILLDEATREPTRERIGFEKVLH